MFLFCPGFTLDHLFSNYKFFGQNGPKKHVLKYRFFYQNGPKKQVFLPPRFHLTRDQNGPKKHVLKYRFFGQNGPIKQVFKRPGFTKLFCLQLLWIWYFSSFPNRLPPACNFLDFVRWTSWTCKPEVTCWGTKKSSKFQEVASYTTLHYTTLHYTALHYTTLHYTA